MKQLIEEQKEFNEKFSYIADALDFYTKAHYPTIKKSGTEHLKDITDWHKQSLKQLIDGLVESLDGKREKDLSDKDIEDRLRVFTLTPSSEESIKEFVKVIGGISAKMGKNKAINDQISHLKELKEQME